MDKKLQRLFRLASGLIVYEPDLEGQRIRDLGTIAVGNRAGPEVDVTNLCHELAHFIDIDDVRARVHGWGLKLPERWVYNRMCIEPMTCQATQRELNVAAWQLVLERWLGIDRRTDDLVSALRYMPDTAFVPLDDGSQPYAEGAQHGLDYSQIQWSQHRWRVQQVEAKLATGTYNIDALTVEWNRKVKSLTNHL